MKDRYLHALPDLLQALLQVFLFPRQETVESEFPRVRPAHGNRRDPGAASRDRDHGDLLRDAFPDDFTAGVGDTRRSRVRHQCG